LSNDDVSVEAGTGTLDEGDVSKRMVIFLAFASTPFWMSSRKTVLWNDQL
jgi:hypothetical protein